MFKQGGSARQPELSVLVRNFAAKPQADWQHLLDQAQAADQAGIDRIYLPDHLVFGRDLSAYADPKSGGVVGGVQPTPPDGDWLEPLTVLAALAVTTSRVKLATNVLVAALRPPVLLAKTAATIDVLSRGRLELGVGVGWQEAEYRALGVPFARRGKVLDELLEVCHALWTRPEVTYEGDGFTLDQVHMMPKPVRPGGVPIWLGGRAIPAVARRLARYGAGWIPWATTRDSFADDRERMRSLVEANGGDFARIRVAYPLPTQAAGGALDYPRIFADVPALVAGGVSDFRLGVRLPTDQSAARDLLAELNGHFRRAVTSVGE